MLFSVGGECGTRGGCELTPALLQAQPYALRPSAARPAGRNRCEPSDVAKVVQDARVAPPLVEPGASDEGYFERWGACVQRRLRGFPLPRNTNQRVDRREF